MEGRERPCGPAVAARFGRAASAAVGGGAAPLPAPLQEGHRGELRGDQAEAAPGAQRRGARGAHRHPGGGGAGGRVAAAAHQDRFLGQAAGWRSARRRHPRAGQ
eukprot:1685826-Pyramimonas_sp.AAC.1